MARRVIIHIGTEKTGSSSIQAVGRRNRPLLLKHGVLYPTTPGNINHIGLTLALSSSEQTLRLRHPLGLADMADYHEYRRTFWVKLTEEVRSGTYDTIVCSNEHLSSRIVDQEPVQKLVDFFGSLAETVRIVVYLRPQYELITSSYSTRVKMGYTGQIEDMLPSSAADRYFNYARLLDMWAKAAGEDNVDVRVFDRDQLIDGDVVTDFYAGAVGLTFVDAFKRPQDQNPSLDSHAAEFLRRLNKEIPPFVGDVRNGARRDIANVLSGINFGPKIALSPAAVAQVTAMFQSSNDEVARRFLKRPEGSLFRAPKPGGEGSSPKLSVDDAVKIAAELWRVGSIPPRRKPPKA